MRDPTSERTSTIRLKRISIHRSLAGPDRGIQQLHGFHREFQSTGPLRDPTSSFLLSIGSSPFQSTGPLRDPTNLSSFYGWLQKISIHRSLAGPDGSAGDCRGKAADFNPQVPCGTRRTRGRTPAGRSEISIHRSLAGPDICEEYRIEMPEQFQSTGPLRDPTGAVHLDDVVLLISIHRSLAGPDEAARAGKLASFDFNPQVPCGTRREYGKYPDHGLPISIHRSLAGPDIFHKVLLSSLLYFNPQVPCGTRLSTASRLLRHL